MSLSSTLYASTPSIVASYSIKIMYFKEDNKFIRFELWDTSGEERFSSILKIFYQNANVFILVYDVTNRDSFIALKEYWIKGLKDYALANVSKIISF